jgi:hypothetical protein
MIGKIVICPTKYIPCQYNVRTFHLNTETQFLDDFCQPNQSSYHSGNRRHTRSSNFAMSSLPPLPHMKPAGAAYATQCQF